MKKIVIATDSYKECMSGLEVAQKISTGFKKEYPNAEYVTLAMADGGEGTVNSLVESTDGKIVKTPVLDALGREIEGYFGISNNHEVAFIEMATASGLELIKLDERNPMLANTYGTGQLIKAALDLDVKHLIIGIGGSATNDAGMGMACALGVKFLDKNNNVLDASGANIGNVEYIDISEIDPRLSTVKVEVACDVDNPLFGPNGASHVFGRQKGADLEMRNQLDANLNHFGQIVEKQFNRDINLLAGGGAAGGLGAGLALFLDGELKSGVDIVSEYLQLENHIKDADLVITGEGRMDQQSIHGKAPIGVAKIAKKHDVKVIAICGALDPNVEVTYDHGIDAAYSIMLKAQTLAEAFEDTSINLEITSRSIARTLKINPVSK